MTDTFGRRLEAAAQDEYHRQCNIDDIHNLASALKEAKP